MSKVYFKKADSSLKPNEISNYARGLVDTLLKRENSIKSTLRREGEYNVC